MGAAMRKVYIRSRRMQFGKDGHPALNCYPDGSIKANTFGKARGWEEWNLRIVSEQDGVVALKSWWGKFLSAKGDGQVKADAYQIGACEKWKLIPSDGTFVALQSCYGKYLCCDDFFACGNVVKADRQEVKEWEEWVIVDDPHAFTNPGHTMRAIGGTLVGFGIIGLLGGLAIPLLGFGVAGVVAGSAAATGQSVIYGGATTGVFSVLQSVGATLAWVPVASGGAAATSAGATILASHHQKD